MRFPRSPLLGLALLGLAQPAAEEALAGRVTTGLVTSGGWPLAGAIVRVYGGEPSAVSGADGRFVLSDVTVTGEAFLTAAKPGYYNVRRRVPPGGEPVQLELEAIPVGDTASYAWQDPTPDPARKDNCGNCHSNIYAQWRGDAHAHSAVNPVVLNLYNGTDAAGRANVGPGYRLDWSDGGNCASCHAPMSASRGSPTDLNQLVGVERTGVSCDYCHKVKDVSPDPRFPHFAETRVLRPPSGSKLIFGPLADAIFPKDVPDFSYSPLFKSSRFCAGCHDGAFWGTPVYETYTEWRKSPYAEAGIQCQQCHMRPTTGLDHAADEEDGGIARPTEQIGSHRTMGESRSRMLEQAVRMETSAVVDGSVLEVAVSIVNAGAGHHVPTGQPMRHMLLLVSAADASGRDLRLLSGERVPVWGGSYGGRPGKGFAKILASVNEYAKEPTSTDEATSGADFPAPFWRRTRIVSDNRIPAQAEVKETYWFDVAAASGPVAVTTRLLYRRAFEQLALLKGWDVEDLDLARNQVKVEFHR
jgi:hypothetical protein